MNKNTGLAAGSDFTVVPDGPMNRLWQRLGLAGDDPQAIRRRIIALVVVAWAPLLLLTLAEGNFTNGSLKLPFSHDVGVHVRLLLALPMLILAEPFVHRRMRPIVGQFLSRGLIPDAARPKFDAAIASAMRLRDSVAAEVLLIMFVYVVGALLLWQRPVVASWYTVPVDGKLQWSLAGWWLGCVSMPLFQFLLLRWYFRLFIWARFLWYVSRIDLRLVPTHPDECGGLGFLAATSKAFAPLLLIQGVVLTGMMANLIFFAGAKLADFRLELIGLVAIAVFAVLGPLLVFTPKLATAKRVGLREYGVLAQSYVREFDHKWLRTGAPAKEPLIGSPDIQSLADLGNSFAVVKGMSVTPFSLRTVLELAVATLLPVSLLLLTMIPLEELLVRLAKLVF